MTAPGPGHNGGPGLERGQSWRAQCWRAARAELLPKLPIEVVRLRVRRAAEIGLDYHTYAGVRAATGHDLIAFLFSNNALRLLRDGDRMQAAEAAKLAGLTGIARTVAVHPPLDPARMAAALAGQGVALDAAARAPGLADGWRATRVKLREIAAAVKAPTDRILVIGDTMMEAEWPGIARMAGYLPADRFFAARTAPAPSAGWHIGGA